MSLAIYSGAMKAIWKLPKHAQKSLESFMAKFNENSKSAAIHLEPIGTFKDARLRTARVTQDYRAILREPEVGTVYTLLWVDKHDAAYRWAQNKTIDWNPRTESYQVYSVPGDVGPGPFGELQLVAPPGPSQGPFGELQLVAPPGPSQGPFGELQLVAPPGPSPLGRTSWSSPNAPAPTDDQLLNLGVPEALLPSVKAIKSMADLEALYDYLPIEPMESLSMLLEGTDIETLLTSIEAGKSGASELLDQLDSDNNRASFIEVADDEQLERMINGDLALWQLYLHREQRALVEMDAKGPTKVSGGAGTGKTVAALHRAKWLEQHGEATAAQPILFTTYTKALKTNLADLLRSMRVDPTLVKLDNLDHLAMVLYRELQGGRAPKVIDYLGADMAYDIWAEVLDGLDAPSKYPIEFLRDEHRDVILAHDITTPKDYMTVSRVGRGKALSRRDRAGLWQVFEAYDAYKRLHNYADKYEMMNEVARHYRASVTKPYRHVIVDELQDFSNVELRMLRALAPEASNDLFLVGDPYQRIYAGQVVFSQAGINVRGRRSKQLRLNYRTTEAIRRAAVGIVAGQTYDDFDGGTESLTGYRSLRLGEAPTYVTFPDERQEAEAILTRVEHYLQHHPADTSLDLRDIAVAFPTNSAMKSFRKLLHERNVMSYDITSPAQGQGNASGLRLSTLKSLKGLEFKVVLIGGISEGTFPRRHRDDAILNEEERAAHLRTELSGLYVALTRAIWRVEVTGVGERSGALGAFGELKLVRL